MEVIEALVWAFLWARKRQVLGTLTSVSEMANLMGVLPKSPALLGLRHAPQRLDFARCTPFIQTGTDGQYVGPRGIWPAQIWYKFVDFRRFQV